MAETMSDSERIDALEARIAYQDQTIEELNAALTEQWTVVEQLRRRMELMEEQVRSGGGIIADPATEPPPPHY